MKQCTFNNLNLCNLITIELLLTNYGIMTRAFLFSGQLVTILQHNTFTQTYTSATGLSSNTTEWKLVSARFPLPISRAESSIRYGLSMSRFYAVIDNGPTILQTPFISVLLIVFENQCKINIHQYVKKNHCYAFTFRYMRGKFIIGDLREKHVYRTINRL